MNCFIPSMFKRPLLIAVVAAFVGPTGADFTDANERLHTPAHAVDKGRLADLVEYLKSP